MVENQKTEKKKKSETIIIAPHPDDEIIGCWEILQKEKTIIIYSPDVDNKRKEEATKLKDHTKIVVQLFLSSIPPNLLDPINKFYFPDPIYEHHPLHRQWGIIGEQILRAGYDVIFYNTNMQAPYTHEVKDWNKKKALLNKVYPSQKSLWKYDHRFFLFEGRYKWII